MSKKNMKSKKGAPEDNAVTKVKWFKRINFKFVGFVIPIAIYFMGFSYHSGWLSEFGVNNEFFPRGVEYHFIMGFYVFVGAVFSIANHYENLVYLVVFVGFVYLVFGVLNIDSVKKFLMQNQKKQENSKNTFTAVIKNTFILIVSLGYFFFSILVVVAFVFGVFGSASSMNGSSVAKELKTKYQTCFLNKANPLDCVFVYKSSGEFVDKGVVIAKNEGQLLVWNGINAKLYSMDNLQITFQNGVSIEISDDSKVVQKTSNKKSSNQKE